MIPINELRIGSWVYDEGNQLKQISLNDDDFWHTQDFEPISLTPEILEKCGLKFKIVGHDGKDYVSLIYFGFAHYLIINNKMEVCCGEEQIEHVKYLHQLQNLYFALEGKELEINL